MLRKMITALLVLTASIGAAAAQVQIDKRRPASKNGEVSIESSFGSIKVVGWDKDEVAVTGRLAPGAEGIDLEGEKGSVSLDVQEPDEWRHGSGDDAEYRSDLEVSVPRGSQLRVESINATVSIVNVDGELGIETVNGGVIVTGAPRSLEITTVTGAVETSAATKETRIETVSGKVTARGGMGEISVRTVSGPVDVTGRECSRVEIETTSGDVRLEGDYKGEGGVSVKTFNGNVTLVVPPGVAARFRFETFSGQIENEIGGKPRRSEKFSPYQELRFSTALNDFEIEVETYSGNVALRVNRGGAVAPAPVKKQGTE
jgi:hypothetical protein